MTAPLAKTSQERRKSRSQTLLLKAPRSRISTLIGKTNHHRPTQGKQAALQRDGKRRKQPRPDTRVTICPPEDEDTSSDDEEIIKSTNKKRTPIHQLVDELENEVQNPRKKNKK
jgi:hypothetical protein